MAGRLILTVGIPGCGKSTWSQAQKQADPEGVRVVERDELRTILFGQEYCNNPTNGANEKQVTQVARQLIQKGLQEGKTVIVSDTNTSPRTVRSMAQLAKECGATVEAQHFDVDPQECKRRNRNRSRQVPEKVMDDFAARAYGEDGHLKELVFTKQGPVFVEKTTEGGRQLEAFSRQLQQQYPEQGKAVVLIDVDGTLAHNWCHSDEAFGGRVKKDFNYEHFYNSLAEAPVNEEVRDLANRMRREEGLNLWVLTGRSDESAQALVAFLERSVLQASRVLAKRKGDFRPDADFKTETLSRIAEEGYVVVHAIDDRPGSVAQYKAAGITVSQVPYHEPVAPSEAPESYPAPKVETIYGSGACLRCGQPLKQGNIGPKCRTKQ